MTRVTAVVLSYNRQDALRRQLLYYANKPIHLIFADGSDEDWGSGDSGSIGEMTWEYFRIPGYYSYAQRLNESVSMVKTKFVFMIDDEECILWSGVLKSCEFLNANPDHSCAGGHATTAQYSNGRLGLLPHYSDKNVWEILEAEPHLRLEKTFRSKNTKSLFYMLLRTEDLRIFAKTLVKVPITGKLHLIVESMFCGYLAIIGRYAMGVYPYWIRYGNSLPSPSIENSVLDQDSRQVVARALFDMAREAIRARGMTASIDDLRPSEISKIFPSTTTQVKSGQRSFLDSKNISERKFKVSLSSWIHKLIPKAGRLLFHYTPFIYQVLSPNGFKTFSRYAKLRAVGDSAVKSDLLFIERIWKEFPNGVSELQLRIILDRFDKVSF